jgi:AcrR family transcriptional regulator
MELSSPRRTRAPQGEGARLRADLLDGAARILAREGRAEAVTLRAVAREVGVSAPSIYLHFANRDELLQAVLARTFEQFAAHLVRGYAAVADDDPVAALRAGCRAYCTYALELPNEYAVLFEGLIAPAAPDEGMDAFGLLQASVAAVMDQGRLPPGDAFAVARRIWTHLHGAMMLRRTLPGFPWQPLEEYLDELLSHVAGVGQPTPQPGRQMKADP